MVRFRRINVEITAIQKIPRANFGGCGYQICLRHLRVQKESNHMNKNRSYISLQQMHWFDAYLIVFVTRRLSAKNCKNYNNKQMYDFSSARHEINHKSFTMELLVNSGF